MKDAFECVLSPEGSTLVRAAQLTAGSGSGTGFATPSEPPEGRAQLCLLVPGSTAGFSISPRAKESERGASLFRPQSSEAQISPLGLRESVLCHLSGDPTLTCVTKCWSTFFF